MLIAMKLIAYDVFNWVDRASKALSRKTDMRYVRE